MLLINDLPIKKCVDRAYFNHLLRAVPARSALFEKRNAKNTCRLGRFSVLNVLNLKKGAVKIHNCALLLDFLALFLYRTYALILSNKPWQVFKLCESPLLNCLKYVSCLKLLHCEMFKPGLSVPGKTWKNLELNFWSGKPGKNTPF